MMKNQQLNQRVNQQQVWNAQSNQALKKAKDTNGWQKNEQARAEIPQNQMLVGIQ